MKRFLVLMLLVFSTCMFVCLGSDLLDGRYSFSLTTFDPSGKLGQVERAIVASSLGTPIVAVINQEESTIVMASPQILPSPLMEDDGTARFSAVAPHIAIAHSGISADGRVLVAAAQRLAVEHAYTFEEPIPIDLFLEELSLLFQEYTMKPGSRPFGATLLVAYVAPPSAFTSKRAQLFRIDPSGSVYAFQEDYAIINGKTLGDTVIAQLQRLASNKKEGETNSASEARRRELSQILQEAIKPKSTTSSMSSKDKKTEKIPLPTRIISASVGTKSGLVVTRSDPVDTIS